MDAINISRFLIGLGQVSARAGILVVLVLAVQWAFRKRLTARWNCALWFLVALRLVLPFSFSSFTSIFNLVPSLPPARASAPSPARPEISEPGAPQMPMALRNVAVEPVPMKVPDTMLAQPARRWPIGIFIAWLSGAVLLIGQILISSAQLWARCRQLPPLNDPAAIAALEECCEWLQVRTKPVLLESGAVKSPALHGFLRPRLLLPKGFTAQFSRAELQFVFLHELAHLKRRDLLLNWLAAALQVVHWFNPLVWLGFARWRADREIACDAMALEAVGRERNQEYGRTILRLLESFAHPVATPGLVGILEDKRQLRRRIDMIASYMPSKGWPVLAAVLMMGLAAIGLTDARSQAASGEPSPMMNSEQQTGYDIHLNNHNPIPRAGGITLVAMPATSDFNSWHAEGVAMAAPASAQPANGLIGAWVLVGTPDHVGKAPSSGGRFKFYTGKTFCATQADPKTGVVIFHHGGIYSVNGNEYVERVEYANPTTMNFIGGTNGHFNLKLEGDTLTLIGNGNPWKEVWKRADKAPAESSQAAKGLIGTWVFAGKPGRAGEPPERGARYKFITAGNWCDTQSDAKTGVVTVHHGGTWAFKGDNYSETVKYANPGTMQLIGTEFKFNAKVDGDTLTLVGIGNPWQEVWKRVK